MKRTLAMLAVLAIAMAAATLARAQSAAEVPDSPQAMQVEALVNRAAELLTKQGKAAIPAFREKGSEWYQGDVYLWAYDLDMHVLFNSAFPRRAGKLVKGEKDKKGKLFGEEFVKVAQTQGSGWVDYWWPKPGQSKPARKWSYVKAVTIDGRPAVVGAGFYPE